MSKRGVDLVLRRSKARVESVGVADDDPPHGKLRRFAKHAGYSAL